MFPLLLCRFILLLALIVFYTKTEANVVNKISLHHTSLTNSQKSISIVNKLVGLNGGKIKPKAKSKSKSDSGKNKVCYLVYLLFSIVHNVISNMYICSLTRKRKVLD
jgi:hypothetical protein